MSGQRFTFRALNQAGHEVVGEVDGLSRSDVYEQLGRDGLTPLLIEAGSSRSRSRGRGRPRASDVAQVTYQLSAMVSSGIPLYHGLRAVAEQETRPGVRNVIEDIARRIGEGERLADAVAAHERVFGSVYVHVLRAAEESGDLSRVLEYLSEMIERLDETRRQFRGALMYPACVFAVLLIAVGLVLTLVVPRFANMFEERGAELPVLTQALVMLGDSLRASWYVYLGGAIVAGVAFGSAMGKPVWRLRLDALLHLVPGMRRVLVSIGVGRFARVMSLCSGAGLSLIDALELAGGASGRPRLETEARSMGAAIRGGKRLAEAVASSGYLTPFAKRMLYAGEESGDLASMCDVVARHHEREASSLMKNLSSVLEPILIVTIAAIVLVIALAVFLPMWSMLTLVG